MKTEKALTQEKNENLPLNRIMPGDNLKLLRRLPEKSVDFIYIDGPYFTQKRWVDFNDKWTSFQDYLEFMKARLQLCRRVMKETASICLQADYRAIHYLKVEMDSKFGYHNFINELIWDRNHKDGFKSQDRFIRIHETILAYSQSREFTFNMQYDPRSPKEIESFDLDDGDGKGLYHWEGSSYLKKKKDFKEGLKSGKYRWLKGKKNPDYKFYLNTHEGIPKGTVIKGISSVIRSKKGKYSTRKPEELLELLINSFSNPGDIVLDLFCGSGTACVVAKRLGRNYIGSDINPDALKIARRRLKKV
jgi:site-specific DNA-methyltransferase (adenine-specific)